MITATRRMTRIVTNSTPDAEHVPTTYMCTSICKHGQKVKQNGDNVCINLKADKRTMHYGHVHSWHKVE